MGALGILAAMVVLFGSVETAITPATAAITVQATPVPVVVAQVRDAESNVFLR